MAHVSRHAPSRSTCLCCFALGKWANPWAHYYVGNDLDLSLIIRANNNHNNNYDNSNDSSETSGVRAFSPARTSPVCTHGVLDYRNCGVSPFQPISFYMTLDREDNLLLLCLRHACLPRQAPNHSKNIPNSSTRSSRTPFFFLLLDKVDN